MKHSAITARWGFSISGKDAGEQAVETWFTRTQLLIGEEGVRRLAESRVIVFGVGGVGSYAVEALTRAGVGHLTLVDGDVVAPSNLNRQLLALQANIGQPKVEVVKQRVLSINPEARVGACRVFYTPENGEEILTGTFDYLVDAIDQVPAKVDLLVRAAEKGIPLVSAMGAGNKFDPTSFRIADISQTHTCPLAKVVRTELRKRGLGKGIKVVYSVEQPSRSERPPGTISYMPGIAGLTLAGVVLRDLLGVERRE